MANEPSLSYNGLPYDSEATLYRELREQDSQMVSRTFQQDLRKAKKKMIGRFQLKRLGQDASSVLTSKPIWLSVSEAAKLGGVQTKTIRRALKLESGGENKLAAELKFKIVKNRYQIEFGSLLIFLYSNKKLQNKLQENGLGQYVELWKY